MLANSRLHWRPSSLKAWGQRQSWLAPLATIVLLPLVWHPVEASAGLARPQVKRIPLYRAEFFQWMGLACYTCLFVNDGGLGIAKAIVQPTHAVIRRSSSSSRSPSRTPPPIWGSLRGRRPDYSPVTWTGALMSQFVLLLSPTSP